MADMIDVVALFQDGRIQPLFFKYAGRRHVVRQVHLIHRERCGREVRVYFSVSDDHANSYRLVLSSETMRWSLEQTDFL